MICQRRSVIERISSVCASPSRDQDIVGLHAIVAARAAEASGPDGALYLVDWYNPLISHGENPPRDPARWAAVCAGIVRHYNEGWAGGFRHDIRYWEIWNEPDLMTTLDQPSTTSTTLSATPSSLMVEA